VNGRYFTNPDAPPAPKAVERPGKISPHPSWFVLAVFVWVCCALFAFQPNTVDYPGIDSWSPIVSAAVATLVAAPLVVHPLRRLAQRRAARRYENWRAEHQISARGRLEELWWERRMIIVSRTAAAGLIDDEWWIAIDWRVWQAALRLRDLESVRADVERAEALSDTPPGLAAAVADWRAEITAAEVDAVELQRVLREAGQHVSKIDAVLAEMEASAREQAEAADLADRLGGTFPDQSAAALVGLTTTDASTDLQGMVDDLKAAVNCLHGPPVALAGDWPIELDTTEDAAIRASILIDEVSREEQ
jgi:hypothetical protein